MKKILLRKTTICRVEFITIDADNHNRVKLFTKNKEITKGILTIIGNRNLDLIIKSFIKNGNILFKISYRYLEQELYPNIAIYTVTPIDRYLFIHEIKNKEKYFKHKANRRKEHLKKFKRRKQLKGKKMITLKPIYKYSTMFVRLMFKNGKIKTTKKVKKFKKKMSERYYAKHTIMQVIKKEKIDSKKRQIIITNIKCPNREFVLTHLGRCKRLSNKAKLERIRKKKRLRTLFEIKFRSIRFNGFIYEKK